MNHRIARLLFGFTVGLLVAFLAYRWAVDPAPRVQRELEESAVAAARGLLINTLAIGDLEMVDPLAPNRKVGKTYVYREGESWQVSGYYRRDEKDLWHPYLATLDGSLALQHLKISDANLLDRHNETSVLEVLP